MKSDSPLIEYVNIAWRRKYYVLIPTLVGLAIGAITLQFMPQEYEAVAAVMQQSELEVSNDFLRPLVNPYQDLNTKDLNEKVKTVEFLQGLARKISGLKPEQAPSLKLINSLRESFTIDVSGNLIDFRARHPEPRFAANLVNSAASQFVAMTGAKKRESTDQVRDFFKREFDERKLALDAKDAQIAKYKRAHPGALPEDASANVNALAASRNQLLRVQTDISAKEQERSDLLTAGAVAPLSVEPSPSAGSEDLTAALARLEDELAQLRLTKREVHPDVVAKQRDINGIKRRIDEQAEAANRASQAMAMTKGSSRPPALDAATRFRLAAIDRHLASLRSRAVRLEAQAGNYQARIAQSHGIEGDLTRLLRERDALNADYQRLMEKQQLAEVSHDYVESNQHEQFRLELPAEVPTEPVSPNALAVLGLGLALGLAFGIGTVVLLEMIDQTFRYAEEIQAEYDIPVIVTITHIQRSKAVARKRRAARAAG